MEIYGNEQLLLKNFFRCSWKMENEVFPSSLDNLPFTSCYNKMNLLSNEVETEDLDDLDSLLNKSKTVLIEELTLNKSKVADLSEEFDDAELINLMVEEFTEFQVKQPKYAKICNKSEKAKSKVSVFQSRCTRCSRLFTSDNRMRKHVLQQHSLDPEECYHCAFKAESRHQLYQHMESHFANTFYCDFCAEHFQYCKNLFAHLEKHINDRFKFTCAQCENTFVSKLSLTMHLRTHTGEKPYACSFCVKRFSQLASKLYHEKTHTGASSHFCEFCKKGFKSKFSRDSHQRIHTGERPFHCNVCDATFRSSMSLRQHKQVHSDFKPFTCEVCGKSFNRRDKVRIHMRIHTGDKPYACIVCSRRFCQKNDMLKHQRVHEKQISIAQTKAPSPISLCYNGQIFEIQD